MTKRKLNAKKLGGFLKSNKLLSSGLIAILLIVLLSIGGLMLDKFIFKPIKNPAYGASFSIKQAENLGLVWQDNFTALLDDLKIRHFRLMSYWDAHEITRGKFNFESLDWQMNEAAKRGAKVSLGIGLRQPRWPECHQPEWASRLDGNEWKQALYAYMEVVANRYKDHPALDTWQLENEGMNNWFGKCDAPDRQRLVEEFDLLKKWDPNHKIIMSLSDQHGLPLGKPVPDVYGFSVYRTVYNTMGPNFYVTYPTPIWYHRARAAVIKMIHKKPIMIHELQMEPWGPVDTKLLSIEEQNKSMDLKQIEHVFDFARRTGIQQMDLWGSEWWYWRKTTLKDDSVWEKVRSELNRPL